LFFVDTNTVHSQVNYDTASFGADTHTGVTAVIPNGDINVFGKVSGYDRLIVSTATDLYILDGNSSSSWQSWWRAGGGLNQPNFTSAVPHPTAVFQQPYIYMIGDGNLLHTIDQALNVKNSRVVLPTYHQIIWIKCSNTTIYLGVQGNANPGQGNGVYTYDIINEIVQFYTLSVNNPTPSNGLIVDNNLLVFAEDGRLYQFNGSGFSVFAETLFSKRIDAASGLGNPIYTLIHRNGSQVDKNKLYFLAGGSTFGMPLGIYVYDLVDNNFYCQTVFAYGNDCYQYLVSALGALYFAPNQSASSEDIFAGIQPFSDGGSGNGYTGLYSNLNINLVSVPNVAQIVLPKINSASIQSNWNNIWLKYSLFANEQIVVKARAVEWSKSGYLPYTPTSTSGGGGTWTSSTTFTTNTDLSPIQNSFQNLEVWFLAGVNSGLTAHITNLSYNSGSGLWTVTLDTTLTYVSGSTCYFVVTPFQVVGIITSNGQQSGNSKVPDSMSSAEWIQVKLELQATYSRIKDVIIDETGKIETQ
jgi:hypothetical protein